MQSMMPKEEFIECPVEIIHQIVYEQRLSMSLLLNGTRRWYIATYFTSPPTDSSYFPHYLETALCKMADLITMLVEHGVYQIFMPAYSWHQSPENPAKKRHPEAHKFLIKAIESLAGHHRLAEAYRKGNAALRFYGDMGTFSPEFVQSLRKPPTYYENEPSHYVYYGVDSYNPHNYGLQLAYEYGQKHGHAPNWEDMLEMYYGDRNLRPLDILVGFSRFYSRMGVPYLLDGEESIYATAVTPLALSEKSLRTILYDFLYNKSDRSRDYQFFKPNEMERLKEYNNTNRNTVLGLSEKFESLVYPIIEDTNGSAATRDEATQPQLSKLAGD
ncbi:MAG: hypothetical protein GC179_28600 [Anaerolineaceae bacterium]|nr:hypothetical protein [Anaerolineaceae bacterium]